MPSASHQPSVEESSILETGVSSIQAGDLPLERVGPQEQRASPATAPTPITDPVFIA